MGAVRRTLSRLTRGGAYGAAARLVLGRPRWWLLALAGFLVRGGIVPFALTILVLPSVVGLTTFVGPTAITAAGLSGRFIGLLAASAAIATAWLLLGSVVGSLVDLALIREVLGLDGLDIGVRGGDAEEHLDGSRRGTDRAVGGSGTRARRSGRRLVLRLVLVRLLALVPLAAAGAWGVGRLIEVGYRELVLPGDLARPFVLRVLDGAPDVVAGILVVWLAGELVGATAVRLIVVDDRSVLASLGGALRRLGRSPFRTTSVMVVSMVASLMILAPALLAVGLIWRIVHTVLLAQSVSVASLGAVILSLALWLTVLLLAGVTAAWRSACWSLTLVPGWSSAEPSSVAEPAGRALPNERGIL